MNPCRSLGLLLTLLTLGPVIAGSNAAQAAAYAEALTPIRTQPTEVITATPPEVFSERSGFWPTEDYSADSLTTDRSSLNDRWNSIPGIQAREAGSPTISIRGSAQADRVLKLVEGAPLNMADGVGASDLLIPTEVMSKVSVLKGPSSVFYGSSAMAGAIDHRLRYFEGSAVRSSLADDSGLFGSRSAALILPWANDDKSIRTQASLFHENVPGDYKFKSTTQPISGRRSLNSSELDRATLSADAQAGPWHFATRLIAAKTFGTTPGSLAFPFASTFDNDGTLATLELSRLVSESSLVGFRIADSRINGLYDKQTASESRSFAARTTVNADLRTLLTEKLLVRSFSDVSFNELHASYFAGQEFHQTDADFGQSYELSLTPEFSVQPAYRYQSRNGKIFKALGLIHSSEERSQFITFGEGFRSPSLSDRFARYSTFQGNPNLKPERSWAVESGASFQNGKRLGEIPDGFGAKASVYYMGFDDLVDSQTNGAVLTKINSGKARTFGSEASASYGLREWMLSAAYNYLDSRNETNHEPLRLNPKHQAVLTLERVFGAVAFEAKETLWSSFFDRDPISGNLVQLPTWQTFDFTFRVAIKGSQNQTNKGESEIKGGVLNFFGEHRELTIGYPEPERRFFVSALRYF